MKDYKGGVDYPVSFFYKELLEVYPEAKVLMNVRDPVKWYESVRDSIMRVSDIMNAWPQSWMSVIMGINDFSDTISGLSDPVPTSSSKGAKCNMNIQFQLHITLKLLKSFNKCEGLGMFSAVKAGKETAVEFYHEHVEEVKKHVPKEKLLVFEVQTNWNVRK